ncbi:MAG TPA: hypothetical protein VLG14_04115 [Sphingomonas sp.]|nr:hypothetical protein [Sphingomonas sp.]
MIIQKGYRTAGPRAVCDPNGPVTPSSAPKATALSGPRHVPFIRHSRIANCIGLPVTKVRRLFTIFPVVDGHRAPPTGRDKRPDVGMEKAMNRIIAGVALASSTVPAAASEAVNMRFECPALTTKQSQPPELSGLWDVLMDAGGIPSFGLLSVGMLDTGLGGSLALTPGVVVVRSLKSDGRTVAMIVASREGDVRFDGSLTADGKRMCGIVSYHGGRKFGMIAQKRPDRGSGRGEQANGASR